MARVVPDLPTSGHARDRRGLPPCAARGHDGARRRRKGLFAIEGFLRVLDAHFCCPSRLVTDDDGDEDDEDRVVNVIQQLRRDAEEGAAWRANESGEYDDADWDDDDPDAADDDDGGDGDADADY